MPTTCCDCNVNIDPNAGEPRCNLCAWITSSGLPLDKEIELRKRIGKPTWKLEVKKMLPSGEGGG